MDNEGKKTAGQEFIRWLKPGGSVLFIILGIAAVITLLTSGADPVEGYEPERSTAYYKEHPDELLAELEQRLFIKLDGVESAALCEDGRILVVLEGEGYAAARSAILFYYDASLFRFTVPGD